MTGGRHISLVFREMWDTANLNVFARGALKVSGLGQWYPTSREKRARCGARHWWKGRIPNLTLAFESHGHTHRRHIADLLSQRRGNNRARLERLRQRLAF